MQSYTLKGLKMSYKIKRKQGSLPKYLQAVFKSYEEARNSLRRYMRQAIKRSKVFYTKNTIRQIATAKSLGLSIQCVRKTPA
jgi:vacuolar-type H+-ATPase subunit D/Vma8